MNGIQPQFVLSFKEKRSHLIEQFLKGRHGDFLAEHAEALDTYFREGFEESQVGLRLIREKTPYAIIALGGYGRQEQCVHSDVDLLILFDKKVPKEASDLVGELVYPLWDMGLEVGHATRSIQECITLAKTDIEALTPLLDARFICGISPLYTTLMERVRTKAVGKQGEKIIAQLIQGAIARHRHFGDSAYLLEPNLKEGQGGLRDYHTMLWIANIRHGLKHLKDLGYQGLLSPGEVQELTDSLSFIYQVRNHLHLLAGRKGDQLHFEHQVLLPQALHIKEKQGQTSVERFLGLLHENMERIKQLFLLFVSDQGYRKQYFFQSSRQKKSEVPGLVVEREMLGFSSSNAVAADPMLLIRIFEESSRLKIPVSVEAKRLVRESLTLWKEDPLSSPETLKAFERCLTLSTHDFSVLDDMLSTGLLSRCIPEFRGIANRIQYDEYHLYPVDRHSLKTVQALKGIGTPEDVIKDPLCVEFYQGLKHRKFLLWAALLHDVGKGLAGGDHSGKGAQLVREILSRIGHDEAGVDLASFLVKEHLFLVKTATRRDLNDEATAVYCARRIKEADRLKMLYLLTVADSISTGPKAWNSWTQMLLRDLALKTLKILERGELASREVLFAIESKREAIIKMAATPEKRRTSAELLSMMPPRYMLSAPPKEIRRHMDLYESLKDAPFVWEVTESNIPGNRTITVCAKDAPGLFSKMAGVFTLSGFDILDAQVFTWRNTIALDIFEVKAPEDHDREKQRWQKAETLLTQALTGELDLRAEMLKRSAVYRPKKSQPKTRPHQVVVDNKWSDFLTIVEIYTYDFPGLLFLITDTLFQCHMDVWVAKIATKADQVVDVFYIRDMDGQKIDTPEQETLLKAAILKVLEGVGDE